MWVEPSTLRLRATDELNEPPERPRFRALEGKGSTDPEFENNLILISNKHTFLMKIFQTFLRLEKMKLLLKNHWCQCNEHNCHMEMSR